MARKRVYRPEFRSNVIELVRSGKSVSAVAKEYDIAPDDYDLVEARRS